MKCNYCGAANMRKNATCDFCGKIMGGTSPALYTNSNVGSKEAASKKSHEPSTSTKMLLDGIAFMNEQALLNMGKAFYSGLGYKKDVEVSYKFFYAEILQTDMSINCGNSGGALFDINGNIAGLMTFVPLDSSGKIAHGMSYAITSNTILKLFTLEQ